VDAKLSTNSLGLFARGLPDLCISACIGDSKPVKSFDYFYAGIVFFACGTIAKVEKKVEAVLNKGLNFLNRGFFVFDVPQMPFNIREEGARVAGPIVFREILRVNGLIC
jgi:hypothetical protein